MIGIEGSRGVREAGRTEFHGVRLAHDQVVNRAAPAVGAGQGSRPARHVALVGGRRHSRAAGVAGPTRDAHAHVAGRLGFVIDAVVVTVVTVVAIVVAAVVAVVAVVVIGVRQLVAHQVEAGILLLGAVPFLLHLDGSGRDVVREGADGGGVCRLALHHGHDDRVVASAGLIGAVIVLQGQRRAIGGGLLLDDILALAQAVDQDFRAYAVRDGEGHRALLDLRALLVRLGVVEGIDLEDVVAVRQLFVALRHIFDGLVAHRHVLDDLQRAGQVVVDVQVVVVLVVDLPGAPGVGGRVIILQAVLGDLDLHGDVQLLVVVGRADLHEVVSAQRQIARVEAAKAVRDKYMFRLVVGVAISVHPLVQRAGFDDGLLAHSEALRLVLDRGVDLELRAGQVVLGAAVALEQLDLHRVQRVAHGDGAAAEAVAAGGLDVGLHRGQQGVGQLGAAGNFLHVVVALLAVDDAVQLRPGVLPVVVLVQRNLWLLAVEGHILVMLIAVAAAIRLGHIAQRRAKRIGAFSVADVGDVDVRVPAHVVQREVTRRRGVFPAAVDVERLIAGIRAEAARQARVLRGHRVDARAARRAHVKGDGAAAGNRFGSDRVDLDAAGVAVGGLAVGLKVAGDQADVVAGNVVVGHLVAQRVALQLDLDPAVVVALILAAVDHRPDLLRGDAGLPVVLDLHAQHEGALRVGAIGLGGGDGRHGPVGRGGDGRRTVRLDLERDDLLGHIREVRGRDQLFKIVGFARHQAGDVDVAVAAGGELVGDGLAGIAGLPHLRRQRAGLVGVDAEGRALQALRSFRVIHLVQLQAIAGRDVEVDGAVGLRSAALQIVDRQFVVALGQREAFRLHETAAAVAYDIVHHRRRRAGRNSGDGTGREVDLAVNLAVHAAQVEEQLAVHEHPHVVVARELEDHVGVLG